MMIKLIIRLWKLKKRKIGNKNKPKKLVGVRRIATNIDSKKSEHVFISPDDHREGKELNPLGKIKLLSEFEINAKESSNSVLRKSENFKDLKTLNSSVTTVIHAKAKMKKILDKSDSHLESFQDTSADKFYKTDHNLAKNMKQVSLKDGKSIEYSNKVIQLILPLLIFL